MIGQGQCHVRTVVAIAQSQHRDESALPLIQAWASLGNFGQSSKNEERDMHRWLKNLFDLQLEVYWTSLKLQALIYLNDASFKWSCTPNKMLNCVLFCKYKVLDTQDVEEVQIPCFLPHEILHAVVHAGPEQAPGSTKQ